MAIREQVSGTGKNSKRTDLNVSKQPVRYMSGGTYGEGAEMLGLQQGASMYSAPAPAAPASAMQALRQSRPITPLTAPTARQNEPLMSGIDMGMGPGSEALTLPTPQQRNIKVIMEELIANDQTGEASAIYNFLNDRGF